MSSPSTPGGALVALVADNPETVDELQAYLSRAGVVARGARGNVEVAGVPSAATAVVWFADDFAVAAVIAAVDGLRRLRPGLRIVLVTKVPERFAGVFLQAGASPVPIVLPKPVVGRQILDALRPAEPGASR